MEYREWEHGPRDPLDGLANELGWDDEAYPGPRQGHRHDDRWDRKYTDSWQTGTGWLPRQDSQDSRAAPRNAIRPAIRPAIGPGTRPTTRGRTRVPAHSGQRPPLDGTIDDHLEPETGYFRTAMLTALWYAIPVVLGLLWALTLGDRPEPNCLDPAGNPCEAPRVEALETLVGTVPRLATAVGISLVLAIVMRWANTTWRALTIGFAASVVGAGIATVIFSVIGRPSAV